ncbi:hypothetical protein C8F04DRAFT_1331331 [Mycena alexandri]|uniref:Uncharacterized protein n=1 Tax=Mycena alexandri TaxID=1745969 RepID=A0AAD6RZI3_9AGAR|nr:hypothetical protein C8F04DRAFT_1331331 [Mycena alexandri]
MGSETNLSCLQVATSYTFHNPPPRGHDLSLASALSLEMALHAHSTTIYGKFWVILRWFSNGDGGETYILIHLVCDWKLTNIPAGMSAGRRSEVAPLRTYSVIGCRPAFSGMGPAGVSMYPPERLQLDPTCVPIGGVYCTPDARSTTGSIAPRAKEKLARFCGVCKCVLTDWCLSNLPRSISGSGDGNLPSPLILPIPPILCARLPPTIKYIPSDSTLSLFSSLYGVSNSTTFLRYTPDDLPGKPIESIFAPCLLHKREQFVARLNDADNFLQGYLFMPFFKTAQPGGKIVAHPKTLT